MATGLLSSQVLSTSNSIIYTPTANTSAIININLCNINNVPVRYSIAISSTNSASNSNWLVFNKTLAPYDSITFNQISINSGQNIIANSNTASSVSVNILGFEE